MSISVCMYSSFIAQKTTPVLEEMEGQHASQKAPSQEKSLMLCVCVCVLKKKR
jgi:hypothetical protein